MTIKCGDRVRIVLNSCYRHSLDGLEGTVTAVNNDSVTVTLESDPAALQKVVAPGGVTGPKIPVAPQRRFQFSEVVVIPPPPPAGC